MELVARECVHFDHLSLVGDLLVFGDGAVGQGDSSFSVGVVFPESADDSSLFSERVCLGPLVRHDRFLAEFCLWSSRRRLAISG